MLAGFDSKQSVTLGEAFYAFITFNPFIAIYLLPGLITHSQISKSVFIIFLSVVRESSWFTLCLHV